MNKEILYILYASILAISILYFKRAETHLIRASIGLYILYLSIPLISSVFEQKLISDTVLILTFTLMFIPFAIHVIKSKISFQLKLFLFPIIAAVLFKTVIIVLHLPLAELIPIAYFGAIGFIIYLNIRHLPEIREELRVADLIGIYMIMDIIF